MKQSPVVRLIQQIAPSYPNWRVTTDQIAELELIFVSGAPDELYPFICGGNPLLAAAAEELREERFRADEAKAIQEEEDEKKKGYQRPSWS